MYRALTFGWFLWICLREGVSEVRRFVRTHWGSRETVWNHLMYATAWFSVATLVIAMTVTVVTTVTS